MFAHCFLVPVFPRFPLVRVKATISTILRRHHVPWLPAMVLFPGHEIGAGLVTRGGREPGPGTVASETGPSAGEGAAA